MAIGFQPVVAVKSATGARGERKLRLVAAVSVSLALLVATVAVQRSTGAVSLGEGTDEKMKGWEDGMFPPHATFPAGYHFGNDNGNSNFIDAVFGKDSSFGAGDTFGDDNVFGDRGTFGPGSKFGDKNSFGKKTKFGPGIEIGDYAIVGPKSSIKDGTVVGDHNEFGSKVVFGRRVSIGTDNQFGKGDEFGSNDQIATKNEFGSRTLFGDKIMFGKSQEFGSKTVFASPQFIQGFDQFGSRNYGLQPSDLPESDKRAWNEMIARHPEYVPDRDDSKKVLILRQVGDDKDITIKKMAVKQQAAAKSTLASRQKAIQALENAATTAEADTKVLKLVADSLAQGAPE